MCALGIGDLKGLKELQTIKDVSLQDILVDMLDGDQNLDLKTHIFNPKDVAGLELYSLVLKSEDYDDSSKYVDMFLKIYKRLMVSLDRLGRTEILKTVSSLFDKETIRMSISDRLTTNMAKK